MPGGPPPTVTAVDVRVSDEPASAAAEWMAGRLRDAVRRRGDAAIAVSGGSTAPGLFDALVCHDVPWDRTTVWQVDERVAPDGDVARNAGQLGGIPGRVRLMPVTVSDLRAGARRYAASLPPRFDVVHLGLGDDGHTASWPPHDSVVDSTRQCEVVDEFNGCRRMTLTPRVVNAARSRFVLAMGSSKADIVVRWMSGDPELPIDRVRRSATLAFLDPAAAGGLTA